MQSRTPGVLGGRQRYIEQAGSWVRLLGLAIETSIASRVYALQSVKVSAQLGARCVNAER